MNAVGKLQISFFAHLDELSGKLQCIDNVYIRSKKPEIYFFQLKNPSMNWCVNCMGYNNAHSGAGIGSPTTHFFTLIFIEMSIEGVG
jgi:hypothetical protein